MFRHSYWPIYTWIQISNSNKYNFNYGNIKLIFSLYYMYRPFLVNIMFNIYITEIFIYLNYNSYMSMMIMFKHNIQITFSFSPWMCSPRIHILKMIFPYYFYYIIHSDIIFFQIIKWEKYIWIHFFYQLLF